MLFLLFNANARLIKNQWLVRPALSKGTKKGTLSKNNRSLKGALKDVLLNTPAIETP